jgi:hypothetical protein
VERCDAGEGMRIFERERERLLMCTRGYVRDTCCILHGGDVRTL